MTPAALSLIEEIQTLRAQLQTQPQRLATLERLQRWQVERLRSTYDDYHRSERYREALEFFVRDLYGPHDFRERDRALHRVIGMWYRLLPERAVVAVTQALELEALSQQLDLRVADALGEATITDTSYAQAYRKANRRRDRQRQIWLILTSGRALDALVAHPWIERALQLARRPARLAGVTSLHEFLARGYAAFAKMQGADELLRVIEQRENAIMRSLFDGVARPFDLGTAKTDAGIASR